MICRFIAEIPVRYWKEVAKRNEIILQRTIREEYKAPEFVKNRIEDNSIAPVNISLSQ